MKYNVIAINSDGDFNFDGVDTTELYDLSHTSFIITETEPSVKLAEIMTKAKHYRLEELISVWFEYADGDCCFWNGNHSIYLHTIEAPSKQHIIDAMALIGVLWQN